jgi:hypothetical protein
MQAPETVLDSFFRAHKIQHKTREPFRHYLVSSGVNQADRNELENALRAFRRITHNEAKRKSALSHPPKHKDSSTKRTRKYWTNKGSQHNERRRLHYADEKAIIAVEAARTRARKAAVDIAVQVVTSTGQLMKTLAQDAITAALNRSKADWPCYIIVVSDFIQQVNQCQPGLRLLPDMQVFFDALGRCASVSEGVRGETRKFKQLNFDIETFVLSAAVDKDLSVGQRRSITRFFRTFNQVLREFLEALLECCSKNGSGEIRWMVSLKQSLTHILQHGNGAEFKRLASFILRYTPSDNILATPENPNSQQGLELHVDHALPVGSVILGGSPVPQHHPCLSVYPSHTTVVGPELKPVSISYSAGDLVFFDGSFAHGSFVAVQDRLIYSQFLATSQ